MQSNAFQRHTHRRRLRLIASALTISLVALAALTKKWREVPCRLGMGMKRHVAGRDTVLPSCREKQSMLE